MTKITDIITYAEYYVNSSNIKYVVKLPTGMWLVVLDSVSINVDETTAQSLIS